MLGFNIKGDANDDEISNIAPSHQLVKGKSKFTYKGFSGGENPRIGLTDVEVLGKELILPIPLLFQNYFYSINSWQLWENVNVHQKFRHLFLTYQSSVFLARPKTYRVLKEPMSQNGLSKDVIILKLYSTYSPC